MSHYDGVLWSNYYFGLGLGLVLGVMVRVRDRVSIRVGLRDKTPCLTHGAYRMLQEICTVS